MITVKEFMHCVKSLPEGTEAVLFAFYYLLKDWVIKESTFFHGKIHNALGGLVKPEIDGIQI